MASSCTLLVKHVDQTSNSHTVDHSTIAPKTARNLAQANRFRSGEGDPLAQARPFSPRRERDRKTMVLRCLAQASPISPKRDCTSLKKKSGRLSDRSHRNAWASPC